MLKIFANVYEPLTNTTYVEHVTNESQFMRTYTKISKNVGHVLPLYAIMWQRLKFSKATT